MGAKNEANRAYRAAIKAGTFKGTFNEFTGGRYSLRGGATAARQERRAIEKASASMDAQIRAVGGDPSNFTLEQKEVLFANFAFAKRQGTAQFFDGPPAPTTTTVGVDDTLDDVAGREGVTTEDFLAANPALFPMISGGQDQAVFAGQQLNIPDTTGLPPQLASQLTGQVAPTSSVAGGRGLAQGIGPGTPAGAQFPEGFIGSQLDFSGLSTVSLPQAIRTQAAPATVPEAGRLTQTQSARVLETTGDPSVSGTIEEILSRNPETQLESLLDAFASPSFVAALDALQTDDPPTYLDEKAFKSLLEISPPEVSKALAEAYTLAPLKSGLTGVSENAYWLTGTPDFGDTSAGGGGTTGANAYVDIQGIRRGINAMLRGATGPARGGKPRGTRNSSRGFSPMQRGIMWRIG